MRYKPHRYNLFQKHITAVLCIKILHNIVSVMCASEFYSVSVASSETEQDGREA